MNPSPLRTWRTVALAAIAILVTAAILTAYRALWAKRETKTVLSQI